MNKGLRPACVISTLLLAIFFSSALTPLQTVAVVLNSWTATTASYPMPLARPSCVQYSASIYCIGGNGTNGPVSNTFFATPSSNGQIEIWIGTTNYQMPIYLTSCVVDPVAALVYCIGGNAGPDPHNYTPSVYVASLSSTGIGQWRQIGNYPIPIGAESCAVYSGYVYCIGGTTDGTNVNPNVYYGSLSPNGISWQSGPSPIQVKLESCVVNSGDIYCIGGQQGSDPGSTTNSVYFASLFANGGFSSSWSATTNYPVSTSGQSCVANPGVFYCIGNSSSQVFLASVSPPSSGAGGQITAWSSGSSANYPTSITLTSCVGAAPIYCIAGYDKVQAHDTPAVYFATQTQDATSTTVSCSPGTVVANQPTTCTANVMDISADQIIVVPTGVVVFFGPLSGSCTLNGVNAQSMASCSATFTPAMPGQLSINANYGGDSNHLTSASSPFAINVLSTTTTSVTCPIGSFWIYQDLGCSALVNDTGPSPTTPTGTVTFSVSGVTGTFTLCTLTAGIASGTATCNTTFHSTSGGTATINGSYGGDSTHSANSSTKPATLHVDLRSTYIAYTAYIPVFCTSPVVINQGSTCYVNVHDSAPGPVITPTGTISYQLSGVTGTLTPCVLAETSVGNSACTTTFTPTTNGTATIVFGYPGDQNHTNSCTCANAPTVLVLRATNTVVSCETAFTTYEQSMCTVRVTDISPGTTSTPTGMVSTSGSAWGASACTLVNGSCSFTVTWYQAETSGISVSYVADTIHAGSSGSFQVQWTAGGGSWTNQ